jgi:hypothetical protein
MSSELKLETTSQIIKSDNKDLIFKITKNKNKLNSKKLELKSECYVIIENISSNYIALRVRTTKKYFYAVYPIYSIIKPNSFINIKIIYHSNEEITSVGHKFRFEGFIIDEKEKNSKNILGLFQQCIKNKKTVKGNIIKKNVVFVFDDDNQINLKENTYNLDKKINKNNEVIFNENNDKFDLKKIENEIKECDDLRNLHNNLIKKLDEINLYENKYNLNNNNNNRNTNDFIDKMKIGKEIILKIKNNKFFLIGVGILFLSSTFFGFYLTK